MMMNRAILLLSAYLVGVVHAADGYVVCSKPDGSSRFVSADHCCRPGGCERSRADVSSHEDADGDRHAAFSHSRCCIDVPVSGLPKQPPLSDDAGGIPAVLPAVVSPQAPARPAGMELRRVLAFHRNADPPGLLSTIILRI